LTESGVVIEVVNNTARVRFRRTSACGHCTSCGLKKGQDEIVIETENSLHAKVNDRVEMEITPGSIFKASVYAYIFPLGMLVLGLVIGYIVGNATGILGNPEIFSAICGIVLTALAFFIMKWTEPSLKKRLKSVFRMVSIIQTEGKIQPD
jgi:sigma-E factor negative regulatory protein RseC